MYRYIKGTITEINASNITLECCGIGYLLRVPNPYAFRINEEMTFHVYQHVREDALELFGFQAIEERDLFIRLINVKGLGPRGALAILASSSPTEIVQAIEKGNARYFLNFPGIGQKISQQIILDLKGKLEFENTLGSGSNEKLLQVESALKALGYRTQEIKSMTKNLQLSDDTSISEMVKIALRTLH